MLISELLIKKRKKQEYTRDEIEFLVDGICSGKVNEAQIGAFLMASCINSLTGRETAYLTTAMKNSGKKFDFRRHERPVIDKHSTGGVGDKLSLLIVPLATACGLTVPMISGRGLGHTGGTVDKLESILGFQVNLDDEQIDHMVDNHHSFQIGQTEDIVPADRILYHLRDVTGTVESVGLITASILSKKFSEGLDGLMIDMKVGKGAFMENLEQAAILADSMMTVAKSEGVAMRVLFTKMDEPLGRAVGNWLEVVEAIDSLSGKYDKDIREVTIRLVAGMLMLGKITDSREEAIAMVEKVWDSGKALDIFDDIISAQGGNIEKSRKHYENVQKKEILATIGGYISEIDGRRIGLAGIILGAGRMYHTDEIDYSAGMLFNKKVGDMVEEGECILVIQNRKGIGFEDAANLILDSIKISSEEVKPESSVIDEWL
jgi:pyrimidine-nucleoside phosphorylase